MKSRFLVAVTLSFVAFIPVLAQTPIDLGNGFKPWGSYDGGKLDSIDLQEGTLILHAPILPVFPQRGGKLDRQFLLYVSSHNWQRGCATSNTGSPISCVWKYGGTGVGIIPDDGVSVQRVVLIEGDPITPVSFSDGGNYSLSTWDGAKHTLTDVSGGTLQQFVTMDGTGWRVIMSNPDQYGINQTATIIDRQGIERVAGFGLHCSKPDVPPPPAGMTEANAQNTAMYYDSYQLSPTTCNEHSIVQYTIDPNGNQMNMRAPLVSTTPPLDTMGRPTWPLQNGTLTSDPTGCVNTWPFYQAVVMTFQGANGASNQVKVCYGTFTPQTAFNVPDVTEYQNAGTPVPTVQPTTIILPNSSKWVFSYDVYGDLIDVQLPTGGSISYTWRILYPGIESLCTLDNVWNPLPAARAVATRTVVDNNGHSFTWTYHWGAVQPDNSVTNWVTDPAGNDTVHTFKAVASTQCFGTGSLETGPALHEVTAQYWQGPKDTGTLLKQVDTTYARATMMTDNTGFYHEANVVPTDIQTTLHPSGKVSLVHKDYDSAFGTGPTLGSVISEKVYDWGTNGHGPLLRETDTVYQWEKDSAYLAANLLDLPASTVIVSGSAADNTKKLACPVTPSNSAACAAETDFAYDEVLPLPHLGTPPSGSLVSPPNAVRGNLTTVSKWLDTTNSFVSSQNTWFDTGMLATTTDPMGHTTTYSYDPTDTYVTRTCNAKSQCVYGGYDFNTGLLTSFTDANGSAPGDPAHTTNYVYDSATARLSTATLPPDPSGGQAQTTFSYSDLTTPNVFPITATRTRPVTGALTDSVTTTFDGLGRPYKADHAMPSGPPVTADTVYDGLGRVASVSNPYFSVSDPTYGITSTTYDALDRATAITKPDGSVSSVDYSAGSCVTSTDESGNPRRSCSDALGRLAEVDEPAGGTPATSSTGSLSITGSELSTQVLTSPAVAGTGSVQIAGTPQWKTVSNSSTGGTTKISVSGGEQQYPAGVIAGSGTITFSGAEQAIPATAGVGSASISGTLQ
ncbi:MAG: hypothetical protein ACM3SW_00600, partial [Actinomycetota bacterium]